MGQFGRFYSVLEKSRNLSWRFQNGGCAELITYYPRHMTAPSHFADPKGNNSGCTIYPLGLIIVAVMFLKLQGGGNRVNAAMRERIITFSTDLSLGKC